jgi:hypothetical protein
MITLDQHIGVRIPGGQPNQINHLSPDYARIEALLDGIEKAHDFEFFQLLGSQRSLFFEIRLQLSRQIVRRFATRFCPC